MSGIDRTGWVNLGGLNHFLDDYQQFAKHTLTGFTEPGVHVSLKYEKDFLFALNNCPPLKAIVGKRAKAFNTGKTAYINPNNGKPARGIPWLKKLLKKPNVLQNEKQFLAQQNIYIDIFGYCPILLVEPAGFEGSGEYSSIWNIPPWLFDLKYTGDWLKQVDMSAIYKNFTLQWEGEKVKLNAKNVRFIFDDGIGTENDTNLTIPDSRLVGMDMIVCNIIAAYKSRHTLITRRGALGILSNQSKDGSVPVPLSPDEKDNLQKDFKRYGLVGQPYHVIITSANLTWQQMGYPTKDLMLFEETTENIERLCDAYGWPIELIARGKDVTYDNKVQARKDLYQNTLIPESDSRMEQLSEGLLPDGSVEIRKDFSAIPVLQTDLKTKADALNATMDYLTKLWDADMITKNEMLEELGRPPKEDPDFDKYKSELSEDINLEDDDTNIDEEDEDEDTTSEDSGTEAEE